MNRTVKQAEWDLYKQNQRQERAGTRLHVQPVRTPELAREHGRAERQAARRRAHQRRRTQRVSAEHHAARVQSKRLAH